MNEGALLQDLAAITALAGIAAVLFTRLNFPKVVGYLLVGVLMSEKTWGGGFLLDSGSVRMIGQLGVVFLMFSMGLGFSPSRLRAARSVAVPVAVFDTLVMMWAGYTVGTRLFGWSFAASVFLGAAICDSATTMMGKVIDEMKWSSRPFVDRAVGASVCEDLVCIGVLALVSGVLKGEGLSLAAVGWSLGALAVFLLAVTVFGFANVPRLFESVAKTGDDETLLLSVLGCCFFVSYLAYRFEYSLSLGAFLVGMIAAASSCRRRIAELAGPLRTMFAAVFFISIGLLVDPAACLRLLPQIAVVTAVVVVGKFLNCTLVSIACGESVRTSVQIGMSLAQIGEFAFMVAMLYAAGTGDWTSPMYQITVAVSLVTTIMNPFLLRLSEPFGEWVERRLGRKAIGALETYRVFVAKYRFGTRPDGANRRAARRHVLVLAVLAVLMLAVAVSMSALASRDWSAFSRFFDLHKQFIFCLAANLFAVLSLAPAMAVARRLGAEVGELLFGGESAGWRESLQMAVRLAVVIAVMALFFLELSMLNVNLAPQGVWAKVAIFAILLAVGALGWKRSLRLARLSSRRLRDAMRSEGPSAAEGGSGAAAGGIAGLGGVARLEIPAMSRAVGLTLRDLDVRARTGALVVSVERGGESFGNPGADWVFERFDVMVVMGDGKQLDALRALVASA